MGNRPAFLCALLLASCTPDPFAQARTAVTERLKDPQSAEFSDLHAGSGGGTVCGLVNARNSFGGFTGARPFAFTPPGELLIYQDAGDWGERGIVAEQFEARGCSIGADHQRALAARRALDRQNSEILGRP